MFCRSCGFDPGITATSENEDVSAQSTAMTSRDAAVWATGESDLEKGSLAACSIWSSSSTRENSSNLVCRVIGGWALAQRKGGSSVVAGGVRVVVFMKGSGLRSVGGLRSGLEDTDSVPGAVCGTSLLSEIGHE